jgi:cell division septation protein DedD
MRDYEEKSYYEIQLDNKQLILVFLAGVTVCVLIFVLGVMVGKGKKEAEMASTTRTETSVAAKSQEDMQPPVEAKPIVEKQAAQQKSAAKETKDKPKAKEDYSFYDLDKTETESKISKKDDTKTAAVTEKTPQKEKIQPPPAAAKEPVEASVASKENASANLSETNLPQYTVQVMATASKAKAEQQLEMLKTKGYTAYLDEEKGSGGNVYKVRIGKFDNSDAAKGVATKLKEELKLETWVAVLD